MALRKTLWVSGRVWLRNLLTEREALAPDLVPDWTAVDCVEIVFRDGT